MNRVRQTLLRLAAGALIVSSSSVFAAQPSASTTGPTTAESSLRRISGTNISQAGTVLEGVYISGGVTISASNVTLRNFVIETSGSYGVQISDGATNVVIEDGEIFGMSSAAIYGGNFTARRLYVHDSGNDAFKPSRNAIIEDNWIQKLGYIADAHADGVQMVSGGEVTIRRNNFDMGDQPGFRNSQVIIIQTNNGPVSGIDIEGNWINGGTVSVQIRDKDTGYGAPTDVNIRNNRFGRDYSSSTWIVDGSATMCGNVWDDTGSLMSGQSTCSGSTPPPASAKPVAPVLTSVQ